MSSKPLHPRGSEWHRWDLHFHTPSSFDYHDKSITTQELVDALVKNNIRVVAVTDHHTIDVNRIREMQRLGGELLTVLPGIEFRSELGSKPIHYICLFPENCDLDHVWSRLRGALNLTPQGVAEQGGDDAVYVTLEKGAALAHELGGIVSIHAGAKSNSIDNISNREQYQQRIKYNVANDHVDIFEIGQIKDVQRYTDIVIPQTGLEKPLVIGSDNHNVNSYSLPLSTWLHATPTFRGLLMVLREPRGRVFLGDVPDDAMRIEQNPTKYVRSIEFERSTTAPSNASWFSGSLEFNPGLVAIIGNKGSGKSALADVLGLLGQARVEAAFSFLNPDRFRHPNAGLSEHFSARLTWASGEQSSQKLSEHVDETQPERIKYLPQHHVERICNELFDKGKEEFEQELKAAIFSHVPATDHLELDSLDAIVRFRSNEKERRIDALRKDLRATSRERAALERRTHPRTRKQLEEVLALRETEYEKHLESRPAEVADPASTTTPIPETQALLKKIDGLQQSRTQLDDEIRKCEEALKPLQRTLAVANRLAEKLENFEKESTGFISSLNEDASLLGLSSKSLVSVSINKRPVLAQISQLNTDIGALRDKLGLDTSSGLRKERALVLAEQASLQAQLDAPNRQFQAFRKALSEWEARAKELQGSPSDGQSIQGLAAAISEIDMLPGRIEALRVLQRETAEAIHAERLGQAEVLKDLYRPVQAFIDQHSLTKDKLRLEFNVALDEEGLSDRLLAALSKKRRGSFMGIDEGKARLDSMLQAVQWEAWGTVSAFLDKLDHDLHNDVRNPIDVIPVLLHEQVSNERSVEEIYDIVYGLEYLAPRYQLRWDGKDLALLSPGERGTLLLIFYLLIDKSDIPLVIDQPEENLDNHTVARVVVECIREARTHRQIFLVTHNPNLAVVCDADQVVHASIDRKNGNRILYEAGALEDPVMSGFVTDILEGTRPAFRARDGKYKVCD